MIEYIENAKESMVKLLKTIRMACFGWWPQGSCNEVAGRRGPGLREVRHGVLSS